jgi:DNA-binding MarR family transcriptional regulator
VGVSPVAARTLALLDDLADRRESGVEVGDGDQLRPAEQLGRGLRARRADEHGGLAVAVGQRPQSVLDPAVAERSPLSQTQIAAILGLDRTTILKLGASLERKRLVVRERDPHDRRAYAIAPTAAGVAVREQAFTLLVDCEKRLTPLAGEERVELTDLLLRVVEL